MQLAPKDRQQIREIPRRIGFSGRAEEMGTRGCRGDDAHLRHVTSRTISRRAQARPREGSPSSSESEMEARTERGRKMEHARPLRYSVVFQTLLGKTRGAGGQSITALARSYKRLLSAWAASRPPRAGGRDRPLEGAPVHQSNQRFFFLFFFFGLEPGQEQPTCVLARKKRERKKREEPSLMSLR